MPWPAHQNKLTFSRREWTRRKKSEINTKSIFKAVHPKPFIWVKYMKNQKAGQNRNQPKCREALPLMQVQQKHGPPCLNQQFWVWIPPFKSQRSLCYPPQLIPHRQQQQRGSTVTCAWSWGEIQSFCRSLSGWKSAVDIWVDIICQRSPLLAWLSLAAADLCAALPVCLNKKADKEYLSVSSIWSPRLFESIWVYLAGHADSLWAIYHDKKLQRLAPRQCLPFSCFPPPLSPLLGIDATSKQTSSSHSNRTFLYNSCMGTLHKPLDNPLQAR